jgi:hypothetical protein
MAVQNRRRRCSVRVRLGEVRSTPGVVLAFYRGRGSFGEGWPRGLTPALMALTPLKMGEGLRGELREGK